MNPAEIRRLAQTAKQLVRHRGTCPEAFLVSFIAWEALKVRVLFVGFAHRGLSVLEAREQTESLEIWRRGNYQRVFADLYGCRPENSAHVGTLFQAMRKHEQIRNQYVHGYSRTSPELFARSAGEILEILDQNWDFLLSEILDCEKHKCDPFGTIRKHIHN